MSSSSKNPKYSPFGPYGYLDSSFASFIILSSICIDPI
jgi:hypothetical protein